MAEQHLKTNFPLNNVGVSMLTFKEGPYLENILRWLIDKVNVIHISEACKPMFDGSVDSTWNTEDTVLRVIASNPKAKDVIVFTQESDCGAVGPRQEGVRRENSAKVLKDRGCEWVWIMDADEAYTNTGAEKLWSWFFDCNRRDAKMLGANVSMYTYWKSMHYRVEPPEPCMPVIIASVDAQYSLARHVNVAFDGYFAAVPPEVCRMRHYSWAHSPLEAKAKVSCWGHAHQVVPNWMEDVFLKWKPGCNMQNVHPTHPSAYASVVKCDAEIPESMMNHQRLNMEMIEDKKRIKVVVLNHNRPHNADLLFEKLSGAFDDVELMDSGSDSDKIPMNMTVSLPNVYWEGAWLESMRRWSEYDAIWVVGCDITLKLSPSEYRNAIETSLPFGVWSPCVEGRAHPFMLESNYAGKPVGVKNVEGISFAVSGELIRSVGKKFEVYTKIGFGQDYWMCAMARQRGMKNVIDGRVSIIHPESIGYSENEAHAIFDEVFSKRYGVNFRRTLFDYQESFEGNLLMTNELPVQEVQKLESKTETLTIVTVENGWGIPDFERITAEFPNARKIVMQKGAVPVLCRKGIEVVPYDPTLGTLLKTENTVALFTRLGTANKEDMLDLQRAGIPCVVNVKWQQDTIDHEKNGFLYEIDAWAINWLKNLHGANLRKKIHDATFAPIEVKRDDGVIVSVITPTYRRPPTVIMKSIGCLQIQTMPNWEQLICSDGSFEGHAEQLVKTVGDKRVSYFNTNVKKDGDYGNTVRLNMMKKAKGKYLLFLDDDNLILPHYLERMIHAIENTNSDFAVCKVMHFGPLNESIIGKAPQVLRGVPVKLYHVDPLQILVKREVMLDIGWDTEVGYLSDGVTLEKLGSKYKFVEVTDVLGIHY